MGKLNFAGFSSYCIVLFILYRTILLRRRDRKEELLELVDSIAEIFVFVIDGIGPVTNGLAVHVAPAR